MQTKKIALIPLLALVLVFLTLSVVTAGVLISQQNVPSAGSIGGKITSTVYIGVYSDPQCTVNCTNIDWGSLNSGDSVTKTVYIKNNGDTAETMTLSTTNWNPTSASSILSLTWNQEGSSLNANTVVPATLTMHVASDTGSLSTFSFNIVVSGVA